MWDRLLERWIYGIDCWRDGYMGQIVREMDIWDRLLERWIYGIDC